MALSWEHLMQKPYPSKASDLADFLKFKNDNTTNKPSMEWKPMATVRNDARWLRIHSSLSKSRPSSVIG